MMNVLASVSCSSLLHELPHRILQASLKSRRGDLGCSKLASPKPRLQTKFDFQEVPSKKAASTLALSKPDIGPQSRPRARAAIIRYAPCRLPLRKAVDSINGLFP